MTASPTYLVSVTNEEDEYNEGAMSDLTAYILLALFTLSAFVWVIYMAWERRKRSLAVKAASKGGMNMDYLLEESANDREQAIQRAHDIQAAIREGTFSFYRHEIQYVALLFFPLCIGYFVIVGSGDGWTTEWTNREVDTDAFQNEGEDEAPKLMNAVYTTIAMMIGCLSAHICVYFSAHVATEANARIVAEANHGVKYPFMAFVRAGSSIGMFASGVGVGCLSIVLIVAEAGYGTRDHKSLYNSVAGFALGACFLALVSRLCASVYTKSSAVGARIALQQLSGTKMHVDDPRNPAVIADHVGLIVSNAGGSTSDLFGSFAVAVCSSLILSSSTSVDLHESFHNMGLSLLLMASSIISSGITIIAMVYLRPVREKKESERILKNMIPLANAIQTVMAYIMCTEMLPDNIRSEDPDDNNKAVQPLEVWACVTLGIWTAYFLAKVQEYYVSPSKAPVRQMGEACRSGPVATLIFGLSVGFSSTLGLATVIAALIYTCSEIADYYGIGYCAVGIVGTMGISIMMESATALFGNALAISKMSGQSEEVNDRIASLNISGTSVTSISKGISTAASCLACVAAWDAYVVTAEADMQVDKKFLAGLFLGGLVPYWFSSVLLMAIGRGASAVSNEIVKQFATDPSILESTSRPNYKTCVEIATKSALRTAKWPVLYVALIPVGVGVFLGTKTLSGVLVGAIVVSTLLGISTSTSGAAWMNTSQYIFAGKDDISAKFGGADGRAYSNSLMGCAIGLPLSEVGPCCNMLMKMLAIQSVVLSVWFHEYTSVGLLFEIWQ